MSASVATLSAHNLRKKYKSRTVVTDVSFEVAAGEVVGLLGPNGAGKTTCFYMIVGLVAADGGEIRIESGDEHQRLTHMPIHQRAKLGLSYLPQENSVFRKLTVAENVRAVLELQGLDEAAMDAREEMLLQELHITHIRKNLAASLSGGERRRVTAQRQQEGQCDAEKVANQAVIQGAIEKAGDGQGQANGAEDQNESPNDDLRSYLQYLKDAGNDKNNRCIVGHLTDTVRLLQSGVGTRSSGHCFDEVCQIETEDQHHNGSYNFRDVKKDRVEGLGDPG